MKTKLLSTLAILFSLAAFSQSHMMVTTHDLVKDFEVNITNTTSNSSSNLITSVPAALSTPFWTDNFDSASTWILDNNNQTAPNGWSIGTTVNSWYLPNPISSTSGGNFAEMTNGDPSSSGPGSWPSNVIYTMTSANPIDVMALAGTDAVMLSFEEFGARFNDLQEVQISTDGISFTTVADNLSYSVLSVAGGSVYDDPSLRVINIQSAISGNSSSVWIRFRWTTNYPTQATDPNVWVAYGWMIDDVSLFEIPSNLIAIEDAVTGGFWVDYQNYPGLGQSGFAGLDYSVIPVDQVNARPFSCEAVLRNTGQSPQSVVLNYSVSGPGGPYSGVSAPYTLAYNDSALVAASPTLTLAVGTYNFQMFAEADSAGAGLVTTMSGTEVREIVVSEDEYGKDVGPATGERVIGGPDDQNEITTRFEMYASANLTALRVYIETASTPGAKIYGVLYEADSTASDGLIFLTQTVDYTLTAQDRGQWVDVPFSTPYPLSAGFAYEFGVGGYQLADESIVGMTANPPLYNGEHSLFDVTGVSSQSAGSPTWYYITSTPMIRMSFDASATPPTPTWDCDGMGNCSDPGTGNGLYSSLSSCQSSCIAPSWTCTPDINPLVWTCADPGDGSGSFATKALCDASCAANSVNENLSKLIIYPNPTNGIFTIEFEGNEMFNITINNILGVKVYSNSFVKNNITINMSNFEKGIYTIEMKNKSTNIIKKIIVK